MFFNKKAKKEEKHVVVSKERDAFLIGIIGHNGTGKSVTAANIARWWREANPYGEIWAHDPTKRFQDVLTREIYPHQIHWAKEATDNLRNGLLILDELRILHPKPYASQELLELLAMRREFCIDIIYIVHNPALVLEVLTYYTTHYYLFYTQSKVGNFEKRIPNYLLAQAASNFVNKYVRAFGRGNYPNFPFIVVDNEKQSISAFNMKYENVKKIVNN